LVEYLNLSQSQVEAIQQVMVQEQQNLEPLMTELRTTRARLLAVNSEHINEKEVKGLADREANVLAKLIVANARMQSKIYKILSPDQQKKLKDLERAQGTATDAR
jgi:Spy/CpxP family protein refolding chaperone